MAQGFGPAGADVAQGSSPAGADVAQGFISAGADVAQGFSPARLRCLGLTPVRTPHDNGGVGVIDGPADTVALPHSMRYALAEAGDLLRDVAAVLHRNPGLDPDTVRHTLALLRLDPLTRLNRSLLRGQSAAAHRT